MKYFLSVTEGELSTLGNKALYMGKRKVNPTFLVTCDSTLSAINQIKAGHRAVLPLEKADWALISTLEEGSKITLVTSNQTAITKDINSRATQARNNNSQFVVYMKYGKDIGDKKMSENCAKLPYLSVGSDDHCVLPVGGIRVGHEGIVLDKLAVLTGKETIDGGLTLTLDDPRLDIREGAAPKARKTAAPRKPAASRKPIEPKEPKEVKPPKPKKLTVPKGKIFVPRTSK